MAEYSMANRKIAYTLGRAYISDMSSTSGYMCAKYFQEFGPRFFDMSSTSGNMGAKYVQEFGPRCLACHVLNLVCHGVSISCVSINSVSCHVIILFVGVSVPCRGHLANDSPFPLCDAGGFLSSLAPSKVPSAQAGFISILFVFFLKGTSIEH